MDKVETNRAFYSVNQSAFSKLKRMMNPRYVRTVSLVLFATFVLFNFQNCGPSPVSSKTTESSDQVRIVDDWNKAEIQFATDKVELHDEAVVADVDGLCSREHNGAHLEWALFADEKSGRPLLTGQSSCAAGQFNLDLSHLDNVVCGIPHRLAVEGDWGATAQVTFEKRCQPLASEPVAAPDSSPAGTDCSLEYEPSASGSACKQICYRSNQVVFAVTVDSKRCSSLMQKLASP